MTRPHTLPALAALALLLAACSSASPSPSTTLARTVSNAPTAAADVPSPTAAAPQPPEASLAPSDSFVDAGYGWIARANSTGGQLLATADGGKTWNTENLGSLVPSAVSFVDPMHGWVAGTSSPTGCGSPPLPCYALIVTADGGHTWTNVKLPENEPVTQIALVSPQDGWILMEHCNDEHCSRWSTEISRTTNGGATWHPVDDLDSTLVTLFRVDAQTSWIVTESYVFRTADGIKWAAGNNPCHLVQPGWDAILFRGGPVWFADRTHGWMACLGPGGGGTAPGTLYRTEDGGLTWNLIGSTPEPDFPVPPGASPFPGNAGDIRFFDIANGWLAGGPQDGIFRTRDGGRTWQLIRIGAEVNQIVYADPTGTCAMNDSQLVCSTDSGQHWTIHDLPH